MKEFLPIGSIVLLKGGTKRLMICGRIQQREEGEMYDYSACYYPEGILDPDNLFLFNNEDIDTVYFVGMQDTEEFRFRAYMEEQLNKMGYRDRKDAEEQN